MKVYISGKISGLPTLEVKGTFGVAQMILESWGFEVLNPLHNGLDESASWREHMAADIAMLAQADLVYMLPNWKDSKGARIEHQIAKDLGMPIIQV